MKVITVIQKMKKCLSRSPSERIEKRNGGVVKDSFVRLSQPKRTLPNISCKVFEELTQREVACLEKVENRNRIKNMQKIGGELKPRSDHSFTSRANPEIAYESAVRLVGLDENYPTYVLNEAVDKKSVEFALLYSEIALNADFQNEKYRKLWAQLSLIRKFLEE